MCYYMFCNFYCFKLQFCLNCVCDYDNAPSIKPPPLPHHPNPQWANTLIIRKYNVITHSLLINS